MKCLDFEGLFGGFIVVFLISYVLQFILYHRNQRNVSERKTTHAKNDSDVHPIPQRRTMLVPVQQSLLKSVTRLLENKKKAGRGIETKAKLSDQRIELETRKEERTG